MVSDQHGPSKDALVKYYGVRETCVCAEGERCEGQGSVVTFILQLNNIRNQKS